MKSSIHACIIVEGHPICGYTNIARHSVVCRFLQFRNPIYQYEVRYEIIPGQTSIVTAEAFVIMYGDAESRAREFAQNGGAV